MTMRWIWLVPSSTWVIVDWMAVSAGRGSRRRSSPSDPDGLVTSPRGAATGVYAHPSLWAAVGLAVAQRRASGGPEWHRSRTVGRQLALTIVPLSWTSRKQQIQIPQDVL